MIALVAGILALYLVIMVLLWAFQERIAFPAPRAALPDPQGLLGYGERISLRMGDATPLVGWYLPPAPTANPPFPALLWFYGNGETIGAIWPIIRDFRPSHAALLVVDYPGYGASGGRTSEAGIHEAGDLAFQMLAGRADVDRRRIYAYGRSLGSAVATHVAAGHDIAGLILESPFTSAGEMAAQHYRIFPRRLVRLGLDNLERIKRVRCPILILHGTADRLVPIEMGRRLAAEASAPVEFVMIESAGHNDTYDLGGKSYKEKLANFVK